MNNIIYSIIIPHKNSLKFLDCCLKSIPHRDDVEIIVVDDNSCISRNDFPRISQSNLKYIFLDEKQSNYAGKARNVGIKSAQGRWILFADADDYFTDNLNYILDKYKNDSIHDVIYLSALVKDEGNNTKEYSMNSYIRGYINNKYYAEKLLKYAVWTPWSRMVKREFILANNLFFEECASGNDIYFGLMCSKLACHFAVEPVCVYSYFRPSYGSITDTYYSLDKLEKRIVQRIRVNQFYSSVNFIYKLPILGLYKIPSTISNDQVRCYKQNFWLYFKKYKLNIWIELLNAIRWKLATFLRIIKVI